MFYKLRQFENFLLLLTLTLANYWIWQIFSNNLILGITLLAIELGLFISISQKRLRKKYITILSILVLLLFCFSIFILRDKFDQTLSTTSPTEISILDKRHGYLAGGLGSLFTNKYVLHYYKDYSMATGKYLRNIFYSLDPNLYFFRSHPREKSGINEYNKYSPFVLPFFVIGTLSLIIYLRKYKFLIVCFIMAVIITGFISPNYILGPVLIFPVVNIVLYLGFTIAISKIKVLSKK